MRAHLIFALLVSAAAQANDLSLSPVSLSKESSGAMTLRFTPSPEPVVAFQFDLDYDPSAIRLTAFAGEAARLAGKTLYSAQLSPSRVRYLLTGWNQMAILEGPLVRFLVSSTPQAALRASSVTFSNLATTYPNGFSASATANGAAAMVIPGPPVRLVEAGILNAAAFASGALAPGEIATLMGTGIGPASGIWPDRGASSTVLGGTSVWFDGVPAQLLYADPGQINLVVPFGLTGTSTELVVQNGSLIAASLRMPVAAVAPGVFTLNATGTGPAAILNQNATVNSASNPAVRGQIVSIFATGAGAMDPQGRDGALGQGTGQHPILPVSVKIGGIEAEVLYAGSAPGLIAGALQVNCRVPANSPTGPAVEVELRVGGVSSGPGTTLSVGR